MKNNKVDESIVYDKIEYITNKDRIELQRIGYSNKEINEIEFMLGNQVDVIIESGIIRRINYKGEWCDRINQTCQEGYCDCCEIYITRNKKE